jgi:organic radical activating enzyme
MKTYKINEIFYSFQGEGRWTGSPSVFIRFSGCNLSCPFCDTDHSHRFDMTAAEIVSEVMSMLSHSRTSLQESMEAPIIFTGGEPFLQLDETLIRAIGTRHPVRIETNGTIPVARPLQEWIGRDPRFWVTMSPKPGTTVMIQAEYVSELKLLCSHDNPPDIGSIRWPCPVYIQPVWPFPFDQVEYRRNVAKTLELVMQYPKLTLSLQTHKLIGAR